MINPCPPVFINTGNLRKIKIKDCKYRQKNIIIAI